jgi:parallel beta-helix repeat protein
VTDVQIINVWVYQVYGKGIKLGTATDHTLIQGCRLEENGQNALSLISPDWNIITNNLFIKNGNENYPQIYGQETSRNLIEHNKFIGDGSSLTADGVYLTDGTYNTIIGNFFYDVRTALTDAFYSSGGNANIFSENQIYTCREDAIEAWQNNVQIIGNYITGTRGKGIYSMGTRVKIIGNHVKDSYDVGIYCSGPDSVISGNIIEGQMQEAIMLYYTSGCIVSDNIVSYPNPSVSNFYTAIYLKPSGAGFCNYNMIRGNTVQGKSYLNRFKFGIGEMNDTVDYNLVTENQTQNILTMDIYMRGARSQSRRNWYRYQATH